MESQQFDFALSKTWQAVLQLQKTEQESQEEEKKQTQKIFVTGSIVKKLGKNGICFYNPTHTQDSKKFYEGSTDKEDDSFDLDDAGDDEELSVFKNFDEAGFDFNKVNRERILFYVDLEEEKIIQKEQITQEQKEGEEQVDMELSSSRHPILIHPFPICREHVLLALFANEGLPQLMSDELFSMLLQLFRLTKNSSLRIGYNSIGAECWVNHLHFHLINMDYIFKQLPPGVVPQNKFPVELSQTVAFYETNLEHKNKDELNMHSIGVRIKVTRNYPIPVLVLEPLAEIIEENQNDAQESLALVAGAVLSTLVDKNIPHNMMISQMGFKIYVIPRKFDLLIEDARFFTTFSDVCGVVKCKLEQTFKEVKWDEYSQFLQSNVGLEWSTFQEILVDIHKKFDHEYQGKVNEQLLQ